MRLSKIIEILENKAIAFYKKNKDSLPRYILILFIDIVRRNIYSPFRNHRIT